MRPMLTPPNLFFYLLLLVAGPISCAYSQDVTQSAGLDLVGKWENKNGSLFGTGWDECEFLEDLSFKCFNYPFEGDLVLPYDGKWSVLKGELRIMLDGYATPFKLIYKKDNVFEAHNEKGVQTYHRVK
jgi:hypothetical protein